ncbi:Tubulin polyglutamylase TTLL7 [Microtus ochrogaster]|uniref:Tubulin polyglutamylase TTLL7 n=1 Tax=Microtus ochrogaster TaxID=79684 RepID=A0A8J6GYP3_MICOH|nr:Tubulin polyglutamylase TTLL7 [Microtus ochrogaster]
MPYQCTMKRKVRKKKKKGVITANVAGTKFEIVRLVIDEMGFIKTPDEDETSNLIWCDAAVQQEKITELQNYQDHLIVQEYIEKPFLMEGYKFDLRIYILVTSCDPLKIFLYHDGLVRMGTEKYIPPNESNLTQLYMHLTNYSVNKHNERFERNETEDKGSKRSIKWFTEFLQANQHDVSKFWNDISELVVKTLIVAEPHVLHAYRMCRPGQPPGSQSVCFEVLGFDILLDRKLKPWLLEINRAPSFGTDQKIDYDVKRGVLLNALKLLNIRTSDKRKNMAKQKAEAQKRLYGQNPIRRLSPGSSDWEQQRHQLERRKEELKERLVQVRKQVSREEHENRHMGNYRRIYPPEDKTLLEKYESLLAVAFQTFLSGRAASFQRELNNPLKKMREEDILDLLEQCEIDDEKLMGKTARIRGPKPLCCMPECAEVMKKQKSYYSSESSYDSSSSSSSELDENEKELCQKRREQAPYNLKHTSHCKLIQQSNSMRRSVSCPRSISAHLPSNGDVRPFSSQQVIPLARPTSASRSHSLNRASSYTRHLPNSTDTSSSSSHSLVNESLRQLKTKEQEDDLTSQTLFVLKDMRIRFPGKSDAESELMIEDIMDNWKHYKTKVASYWLIKLDSVKQRKVLDIVKSSIRTVLPRIWRVPDAEELSLYRIFNRVFNRLLWSHGQGLWSCFCDSGTSWESIFSKSPEVVSPLQLQCCQRLVELCKQCLLVVYKYTNETRGPISGIGPDWGKSRYLLPGSTQFLMRSPLYNMKYNSPGMTRSNVLFTSRYGHM